MLNPDPTFTIILGELSIILTIVIIIYLGGLIARKRKQSILLSMMLKRVASSDGERKQSLLNSFSTIPGVDSTTLNNIIQDITNNEHELYRSLSSAIINNEFSYFENIENEIHKLVAPYGKLASSCGSSTINNNAASDETVPPNLDDLRGGHVSDAVQASLRNPEFDLSPSEHDSSDNDNIQSHAPDIAVIPDDLLIDDNDTRSRE